MVTTRCTAGMVHVQSRNEEKMAKRSNRATPAINVKCDKCDAKAHSIPGSKHRRCGGKAKHEPAPREVRGTWGPA